jgi:hypothetical protein
VEKYDRTGVAIGRRRVTSTVSSHQAKAADAAKGRELARVLVEYVAELNRHRVSFPREMAGAMLRLRKAADDAAEFLGTNHV